VNRTSVQQQRVRVSLWPSQDGKRLGQVFRDSTAAISKDTHHRALVVLGPVVPRTACSPAVLSQLTLISLKPLISVLEEKKRLTAANTCSTPVLLMSLPEIWHKRRCLVLEHSISLSVHQIES
jgi:hypothetical protein